MNKYLLYSVFLLLSTGLSAQVTDQVSTGAGYGKFHYYKLSDGSKQQVANDAWDLAFSNLGPLDAGIFVNESTSSSMGQPVPGVDAYQTYYSDFSEAIDPTTLTSDFLIFNPETSWKEGAFNSIKDPTNPIDYGWGVLNTQNNKVEGAWVFVLKLRNGQYRKIFFESYDGQQYKFKAANLDGTNEQSYTVSKTLGNGSPVVYFSFANANPVTPTNWDFVFCRYITPLFDGTGYIPYNVTGILTSDGVLTAQTSGVDPLTANYEDYLDSLDSRLDVIGHDWKFFESTGWIVYLDRAYFVKTRTGELYKLFFTQFGGSTTGTASFEKTYLTTLSAAEDLPSNVLDVSVYPNPVADHLNIAFTAKAPAHAVLALFDAQGKTAWTGQASVQGGLNVLEASLPELPKGLYQLNVQMEGGAFSRTVSLQ